MAEIYERWTAAHAVVFVTPGPYRSPSVLESMIDRLVCAGGGNPDPSSTHGKKAREAKQIELDGRGYPKHLAGRASTDSSCTATWLVPSERGARSRTGSTGWG